MPYRRRASYGRRGMAPIITSIKNVTNSQGSLSGTLVTKDLAKAVTSPSPTVQTDVSHGCMIKAMYLVIDVCGLGGTGVLNIADFYLIKNPGANLTPPQPDGQGTSNEKKFIVRTWRAMIMRNQDGNVPYHWEGWIKLPRRYHRMGTDDKWSIVLQCSSGVTGHFSTLALYKWFR